MQLGSGIAVAVEEAGSCSSPSLGISMCHRCGPKKQKTMQNKTKHNNNNKKQTMRQTSTELQGEIAESTIIIRDLNTHKLKMDRSGVLIVA